MKKILLLLTVVGIGIAFGADPAGGTSAEEFNKFSSVVSSADSSAKATMGVVGKWLIGMLPLVCLIIGIFGGLRYLKKKSNGQEENFAKELGFAAGGAFLGLVVSFVLITSIGTGLLGASAEAFTILNVFWKEVLVGV